MPALFARAKMPSARRMVRLGNAGTLHRIAWIGIVIVSDGGSRDDRAIVARTDQSGRC